MANNTATVVEPIAGNVAPTTMPGYRRTDSTLEDRAHNTFDAVGRQQLVGGQDPRQDRAVRGKEERRGDAHRR